MMSIVGDPRTDERFDNVLLYMDTYYTIIDLPIGPVLLVGRNGALRRLELGFESREAALEEAPFGALESSEAFGPLPDMLHRYMAGEVIDFSSVEVEFGPVGSFVERVLRETMNIPFGKLVSYSALATIAGSPGAARAVGNAMSRNPIPIVVPCHRVVHSDGTIGGYTGGLDMKRHLLALEGIEV
jgi:methylated-DNA-[protein]-cysteine S-methyltransferase